MSCFLWTAFFLSVSLSLTGFVSAEAYDELFTEASSLYENGEYTAAVSLYEKVLDDGRESGKLYYNIGNCYFKQDDLGRAILNYERARRLIPRDADLDANYTYARTLIKEPEMRTHQVWIWRIVHFFTAPFTLDELTLFASVLFGIVLIVSGCFILERCSRRTYSIALIITVLIFGVVIAGIVDRSNAIDRDAIIVTKEITARFGPFERATMHFTMYEGMQVRIVEKKGFWYKIKRVDGNTGWIPKDAAEII